MAKDIRDAEYATRAEVTDLPMPQPLTPAEALPGTIATLLYAEKGRLFRIDGPRPGTKIPSVNITDANGRKSYARIGDLQKSDRAFPTLPDFVPHVGQFVTTARIRGIQPTEPWIVSAIGRDGKAKLLRLDGSGASASVPFDSLQPVEVSVAVKG